MTALYVVIGLLVLFCLTGSLYIEKEHVRMRDVTAKMLKLQNELVQTKKDLENVTREQHQKFDPYSTKLTKSIINWGVIS